MPFREAHARRRLARARLDAARRPARRARRRPTLPSGRDALGLLEPGWPSRAAPRRAAPGPSPVAVQLERFRHRSSSTASGCSHAAAAAHVARHERAGDAGPSRAVERAQRRVDAAARAGALARRAASTPASRSRWRRSCSTSSSCATATGRADRRGRGLPGRDGRRLARLPRPDRPQRHDVRSARAPLRLLHLRDALLRQRRLRARGDGRGGAAAGARPRWRGSTSMRAARPAAVADRAADERARPSSCQAFGHRPRADDGADLVDRRPAGCGVVGRRDGTTDGPRVRRAGSASRHARRGCRGGGGCRGRPQRRRRAAGVPGPAGPTPVACRDRPGGRCGRGCRSSCGPL